MSDDAWTRAERAAGLTPSEPCPDGPHRGPQGPNEDTGQCSRCYALSWEWRPKGETYGWHAPDCALPERHESFCTPGGEGHPPAPTIRGYWDRRPSAGISPYRDEAPLTDPTPLPGLTRSELHSALSIMLTTYYGDLPMSVRRGAAQAALDHVERWRTQ